MIRYQFEFPNDEKREELTFDVHVDRKNERNLPIVQSWTALAQNQCPNCPLPSDSNIACPPARDCAEIIEQFSQTLSIESVHVEVIMAQRTLQKTTDMQTALGSLLGLVMASSACPILSQFRGMAHFHLPFASPQETLFRTVGSFLMKQYFAVQKGEKASLNLDQLQKFYQETQEVNQAFLERIRNAAQRDANLNALVILFSTSALVGFSLERGLEDLQPLFG